MEQYGPSTLGGFNTQPPEGGCTDSPKVTVARRMFQHTAARRRLHAFMIPQPSPILVSTHSRPKAAAGDLPNQNHHREFQHTAARRRLPRLFLFAPRKARRFNTQPPEGGCKRRLSPRLYNDSFNTQPPEGGCPPPAAHQLMFFGFNTQPPEGGCVNHTKWFFL